MQQKRIIKWVFLLLTSLTFLITSAQKGESIISAPNGNHFTQTTSIRLSGIVTDSLTGQPLAGSSIYLAETRLGAIADNKGHYQLPNIPAGHHLIEVSHTGYT